ncbi:NAD-dependent epimerase/dehydratase family protein [Streptomyces rhizosphaerihabitans]|uniref:NAD-dependent epimerase/dehydratase family protein n=1 Tax=Streptomyces rhizosphaerihabitans TaxID=1266770 RepID=UPI0021C20A8F|nr:NAD(P)-dependent oxidoreductase [Streptomyces rhizosphaerihabitans]MCT9004211.1 NAD(P)-dependent oxidoreductase [Streptomyces rhizosphaerihabitans]
MLTLVTGATGEVGRRFVPRLLQQAPPGDRVRVLVRDESRAAALAALTGPNGLGVETAVGDLRDSETLGKALAGVDAVVNIAAAFRGVPDDEAWAVNRDAALELGRAAVSSGVRRFVQVSTNLVYGTGRGRPLTEDDPSLPGGEMWGAYPASKAEAERGLLALEGGMDVRVGRLAFVYGEGDPHLAASMRWAAHWAAGQRLQMVHHADVAQGLRRLLYAPGVAAGRICNIADDAPVTTVDLHLINGVEVPPALYERTDPDPWNGIVSTDRIRHDLGFRPVYPSLWTARDAGAL